MRIDRSPQALSQHIALGCTFHLLPSRLVFLSWAGTLEKENPLFEELDASPRQSVYSLPKSAQLTVAINNPHTIGSQMRETVHLRNEY